MTERRFEGGLTLEGAIILPMVIICIVFILSTARTVYIRQQTQSVLLTTAHRMAEEAYILDRVGLVDMQQNLYRESMSATGFEQVCAQEQADALKGLIGSYSHERAEVLKFGRSVTDYGKPLTDWTAADDYSVLLTEALEAASEGQNLAVDAGEQLGGLLSGLESIRNGVLAHYSDGALGLGMNYVNGVLTEMTAENFFTDSIGGGRLNGWLTGGERDLDFGGSASMMLDDTVNLRLTYDVVGLFGDYLGRPAEPVLQIVKVRAWTGSYDSEDLKTVQLEDRPEPIYYVSTRSHDVNCYHVYSCLRKPLTTGAYHDEVTLAGREICQYCSHHFEVTGGDMAVYFTTEEAKIHLDPMCPMVYALQIRALTADEAASEGYYPCSKPGCAAEHEARRSREGGQ